ncbi:AbaSI family restriction endonuclease [Aeromonas sp. R2-4]
MYALHYALRDVKLMSQYPVDKYFIDGYFPDLKIAVEIDEPYHNRQKEDDLKRESDIKAELDCEFFRINVSEPVYE